MECDSQQSAALGGISSASLAFAAIDDQRDDESLDGFEELKQYTLRDYQEVLFRKSILRNIIVCLPTGTGKTMIAINLIRHLLHQTNGKFPGEGKRTIFLAPNRVLVEQQYRVVRDLVPCNVTRLTGENQVDLFTYEQWNDYWQQYEVILFTPQVVIDILVKGFINIRNFNLIIFDEAHWCLKKGDKRSGHPYRRFMDIYKEQTQHIVDERAKPRILALSASLLNPRVNPSQIPLAIKQIESIYEAKVESDDTECYVREANVYVNVCDNTKFALHLPEYPKPEIAVQSSTDSLDKAFVKILTLFERLKQEHDFPIISSLIRAFDKAKTICNLTMGPWFAIETFKLYIDSFRDSDLAIVGETIMQLYDYMRTLIERRYRPPSYSDAQFAIDYRLHSQKISVLLRILTLFRENLNCIIFVNERIDANVLYRWLTFLSENIAEFSFIKVGFICGTLSKDRIIKFDRNTTDFKRQYEEKQLNVMIATAVLEEGIDVPICNLVIRYDFPMNYRAFTQSKGRARDRNSFYLLLVDLADETTSKYESLLDIYYRTEQYLKQMGDRNKSSIVDDDDDDERNESKEEQDQEDGEETIRSFRTEMGAVCREQDAIQMLNHYLQKLPYDYFSNNRGNFVELLRQNDQSPQAPAYCYVFLLPIYSSLSGVVKGEYRRTKQAAKSNCALRVCKLLYDEGEIDHHLNILSKKFLISQYLERLNLKIADPASAKMTKEIGNPQTKKRSYERARSCFSKRLLAQSTSSSSSSSSCTNVTKPFTLYVIQFIGQNLPPIFDDHRDSRLRIGFLSRVPLNESSIESFIYLNQFCVKFRIVRSGSVEEEALRGNQTNMRHIRRFHRHIAQHVLICRNSATSATSASDDDDDSDDSEDLLADENFLFVPITVDENDDTRHTTINYDMIAQICAWQTDFAQRFSSRKKVKFSPQPIDELKSRYPVDQIFACFHRRSMTLRYVKEITTVLPTETFDLRHGAKKDGVENKSAISYAQFYFDRFGIGLDRLDMPMLHAGLLESFVRRKNKFSITYKVPKSAISKKSKKKTKSDDNEDDEDDEEDEENDEIGGDETKAKKKSAETEFHQLFPLEIVLPYPLPMWYFLIWNSIPAIMYRLESYQNAFDFLEAIWNAGTSGIDAQIFEYERDIAIETLVTAKSFHNQSDNSAKENEDEDADDNDDLADDSKFRMLNIDTIEADEDSTAVAPTSTVELKLLEKLPEIFANENLSPVKKQRTAIAEEDYENLLDKLLQKLIEQLPQTKLIAAADREYTGNDIAALEPLKYGDTSLFTFVGDIEDHISIRFNTFRCDRFPNPWYAVKAFTLDRAKDIWNLEQLETVGDAFLKMTTALYLYFEFRSFDEGKLSQLKTALICNENLYKLGLERGLQRYVILERFEGVATTDWRIPFYRARDKGEDLDEKFKICQELKNKDIADSLEAIIGAFIVHGSAGAALRFFRWLGLRAFDPIAFGAPPDPVQYYQRELEKNIEKMEHINRDDDNGDDDCDIDPALQFFKMDISTMVQHAYDGWFLHNVEDVIDYRFKQRFFLVQAFTHPSYTPIDYEVECNHIASYQRLEFIGDAILDYVITYFVYSKNPYMSPYEITTLRSALVNNVFYASITVKYNLHRYLRYSNQSLAASMTNFIKKWKCQMYQQLALVLKTSDSVLSGHAVNFLSGEKTSDDDDDDEETLESVDKQADDNEEEEEEEEEEDGEDDDYHVTDEDEDESHHDDASIDEIDVPKSLSDIFEALIGAIYVDNGFDLDAVWRIVYRMIKKEVDYFSENIPTNPLAWLEKCFVNRYKFSPSAKIDTTKRRLTLTIYDDQQNKNEIARFDGFGQRDQQCKLSAAKRAMHYFAQRSEHAMSLKKKNKNKKKKEKKKGKKDKMINKKEEDK